MRWDLIKGMIGVHIKIGNIPNTRRKLLSEIASVYDPLGIGGPLLVEGRIIVQ